MSKLKMIWSYSPSDFESQVEKWIKDENPNVINSSITMSQYYFAISIVYTENSEKKVQDLLRS